jgi:membrane protein YdbS with pleckstrin-like domain
MPHRNTIWALTLIVLGVVLLIPITAGGFLFVWITGPAAMLAGVAFLLLMCLLATLFALKRPR